MKRIAATVLAIAAAGGFVVLAGGAGSDEPQGSAFKVELDNAFGLIEGGDFKVAGVRAGKITKLDLDRRTKRAVVSFTITEKGFGDLRKDARCEVLPQSLVGEYYVDCQAGRSRERLEAGGTIPVEQTAGTIPPDLVNNIMRRPTRERLSLIVAELGAGVAGNAENIDAALRRATPALRETNKVLAQLADQNQILADLARNADSVVTELASNRRDVGRWVTEARDTAQASAERDDEIAAGFRRLPTFLRELRPAMADLGRTADAQGPALRTLSQSAGQLERLFENIPPFADASRPGIDALGEASKIGRQAASRARPTVQELTRYSAGVPELGKNLAIILEHLDDRRFSAEVDPRSPAGAGYTGLEALLQYVFDQTMATAIHDGNTHILQAFPFEGECAAYADKEAAKELRQHCSAELGPNRVGFEVPDVTAPKDWDGKDRGGPEERLGSVPVPIPLPRRRADRDRSEDRPSESRREESSREQRDERPKAPETPRPKLPDTPKLPDVPRPELPKLPGPSLPAPKAPDVPRVETPRVDATPTRENQEAQQGLLDYLLGS